MKIRTNIFIWGFLVVVVPMLVLGLAATYYAQISHTSKVKQEVTASLAALSAEIERRMREDRKVTLGLSKAGPVQALLPVLYNIKYQMVYPHSATRIDELNRYFEGFGTILPGVFFIRILDAQGNTLIKVNQQQRSKPVFDSLYGYSYVEQELADDSLAEKLQTLPRDDVSVMLLPHNPAQSDLLADLRLFDYAVPLYSEDEWVGTLSLTLIGGHIDQILASALRPYNGQLYMIENNPDNPTRHGLVLYSDNDKLRFSQARREVIRAEDINLESLLPNVIHQGSGVIPLPGQESHLYYNELLPYPDTLIDWLVVLKLDDDVLTAPFKRIRLAIAAIASLSLLVSLIVTTLWTRQLTIPIRRLVTALKRFAAGDKQHRADVSPKIDEIRELASEFNQMAESFQEAEQARDKAEQMMLQTAKLASIGQMAAGIGHEINNPLNNILSYSKLLMRACETLPEEKRKLFASDIKSLREETLRASEIVKGIMNFARQVPPQYASFEINTWLENTLQLAQQAAGDKNITLKLYAEPLGSLQGDRSQLQQALLNLILNAVAASAEDATVIIEAKKVVDKLIIQVVDQGPGIDESSMQKIFDPFFTTKAEGKGTGLGLSISLGIVEHHEGTLTLENNVDAGVTATMSLPLNI